MDELISRRASYGLELIDALTSESLIGQARVTYVASGPAAQAPGPEATVYQLGRSRWVFEDLRGDVVFAIECEFYHSHTLTVSASGLNGAIQRVALVPRVGYPFPSGLTRVVGTARLSSGEPITGAAVEIRPWHYVAESASYVAGTTVSTQTTEGGQYVVWFKPDPSLTNAMAQLSASRFDATATATLTVGGVVHDYVGNISNQTIILDTLNRAAIIEMS